MARLKLPSRYMNPNSLRNARTGAALLPHILGPDTPGQLFRMNSSSQMHYNSPLPPLLPSKSLSLWTPLLTYVTLPESQFFRGTHRFMDEEHIGPSPCDFRIHHGEWTQRRGLL